VARDGQPGNRKFEDRSRALGCLILGVLLLALLAVMLAIGWRSMWWQDSVPDQPRTQRLLQAIGNQAPAAGS
jgi:hypothetical protein